MTTGSRKKGVVLLSTHAEHKQSTGMRWVWGAAFFGIGIILAAAVLCDGFDVQDNLEMGRPADLQGILSVPNEMGAYGALIALTRENHNDRVAAHIYPDEVAALSLGAQRAYVCGSVGFVSFAGRILADAGIAEDRVRVEQFGPSA